MLVPMTAESELFDICTQLERDSVCRKVLLAALDGQVLAHAGQRGLLDEEVSEAVASVVADALVSAELAAAGLTGGDESTGDAARLASREVATLLPNGIAVCAAAIDGRAVLVVIYDGATTIARVRLKMRRARERLERSLPEAGSPSDPPHDS